MNIKLVSGGLDSFIMSKLVPGKNVYVDFGQAYANEEVKALKKLGCKHELISIKGVKVDTSGFIPDRNLFLASLIALAYQPDTIYIAGVKDDISSDESPEAFEKISETITSFSSQKIRVLSPFFGKSKSQVVAEYPVKEELKKTFSCYSPIDGLNCRECKACLRYSIALETNGVKLSWRPTDKAIKKYVLDVLKTGHDDSERAEEFLKYLKIIKDR